MDVEFQEPNHPDEPWIAKVELFMSGGDVVDESGSGRSLFVALGSTKEEARHELDVKLGKAAIAYGLPILEIPDAEHARLWKWIREKVWRDEDGVFRLTEGRAEVARRINALLSVPVTFGEIVLTRLNAK